MATLTLKGKTSARLEKMRESASDRRIRLANELLKELQANHIVFQAPVPLKLNIHKDIKTRYDYPVKAINMCMWRWCKRYSYKSVPIEKTV